MPSIFFSPMIWYRYFPSVEFSEILSARVYYFSLYCRILHYNIFLFLSLLTTKQEAELLPKHKMFLQTYDEVMKSLKTEEVLAVSTHPDSYSNNFTPSYDEALVHIRRLLYKVSELVRPDHRIRIFNHFIGGGGKDTCTLRFYD